MSRKSAKTTDQKWVEAGNAKFTLRLHGVAMKVAHRLAEKHDCAVRDVIEGMLLGTIPVPARGLAAEVVAAMREHGFSEPEARDWIERGGGVQSADANDHPDIPGGATPGAGDPGCVADRSRRRYGGFAAGWRRRSVPDHRRADAANRGE